MEVVYDNNKNFPIGFKIYYGDGTIYMTKFTFEGWRDARKDGVILIIIFEQYKDSLGRNLRSVFSGYDFYCFSDGVLYTTNNPSETRGFVFLGQLIPDAEFELMTILAMEDYHYVY